MALPTTSSREEITLLEELPEPKFGECCLPSTVAQRLIPFLFPPLTDLEAPALGDVMDVLANEQGFPLPPSSSAPPPSSTQQARSGEDSNMQLTLSASSSSPQPPPGGRPELMEEVAQSPVNMPTACAPTLLGTPPDPSHSYYVHMQTPENHSVSPPDIEQELSFTCLEETATTAGQCSMDLTGLSDSAATPKALISSMVAEPQPTAELPPSVDSNVVSEVWCETAPMSLTCMEGSVGEPSPAPATPTTGSGSVVQTAASLPVGSEQSALQVTGDSRMSLTCVAETPQQLSTTVAELTQQSLTVTSTLLGPPSTNIGESADNSVFKQPKMLSRSRRKIRSSGRRVVKPSPVVRTPHTAPQRVFQGSSLLHPPLTPALTHTPRGPHNSTYTITPLPRTATPRLTGPATSLTENPASQSATGSGVPSSPLTLASSSLAVASPSADCPAVMSSEAVVVSQSPALTCSVPHMERVPSDSEWLQASSDSFNLVTENDSLATDPTCPAASPNHSTGPCETPATLPTLPQPPPSLTPVPSAPSVPSCLPLSAPDQHKKPHQPHQLKMAIEKLKSHKPEAPPIAVDTPESVMVEVPSAPDQSLYLSVLNLTLNDTTAVGCPSMLLSPSVYDKFTAKLCSGEGNPQPEAAEAPQAGPVAESSPESPQMSRDQQLPIHSPQQLPQPLTPPELSPRSVPASDVACDPATSETLFSDFLADLCSR